MIARATIDHTLRRIARDRGASPLQHTGCYSRRHVAEHHLDLADTDLTAGPGSQTSDQQGKHTDHANPFGHVIGAVGPKAELSVTIMREFRFQGYVVWAKKFPAFNLEVRQKDVVLLDSLEQ